MVKWTPDLVYDAARTCSGASDFETRFSGAWKAARRFGILQSLSADMGWTRYQPTFEECLTIARNYQFRQDWRMSADIVHRRSYHHAQSKGWLEEICAVTGAPRQKRRVHSRESILAVAARSQSIGRMAIENPSAYCMGKSMGLLDEMRALAGVDRKSWTLAEARAVAAAYRYRGELQTAERGCYLWCRKNGHLEDVCAHMAPARGGFKGNAPASLYYLRIESDTGPIYKIGISRNLKFRFRSMNIPYAVLFEKRYPTGRRARTVEQWLLKRYSADRYTGTWQLPAWVGGYSELFARDVLGKDVIHCRTPTP